MEEMLSFFRKKVVSVDLHGMQIWEAERFITAFLKNLDNDTNEINVIHGFNRGMALANWLRKEYKNRRILRKIVGLNNGVTILKVG